MNRVALSRLTMPLRDRHGGVLVIFAVLLPVMIGFVGLVVDVGMAHVERNRLQSSAEAAALATARYIALADRGGALATAREYAGKNRVAAGELVSGAELQFGNWADGSFATGGSVNAVRVTASRTTAKGNAVRTYFAGMFGVDAWNLSASAVATVKDTMCILLLHPTHSDAFDVDPGAQIDAPDCAVQVNSASRGALELGSSSYVNARSISVVGGVDRASSAVVNPAPVTGARPVADPYAGLSPPVNSLCGGVRSIRKTTTTLYPSLAFCKGLVIEDATVTFAPGVYVIKGELTLKTGAAIRGTGVLIYLEGSGSDLFFYRKTSFDLSAPTTGPYAGIVLWSDRANSKDHDIYSRFGAAAEGTIYMPNSQIEFENNVEWESDCIRIVASRLELDNNSKYKAQGAAGRCANTMSGALPRLVR